MEFEEEISEENSEEFQNEWNAIKKVDKSQFFKDITYKDFDIWRSDNKLDRITTNYYKTDTRPCIFYYYFFPQKNP